MIEQLQNSEEFKELPPSMEHTNEFLDFKEHEDRPGKIRRNDVGVSKAALEVEKLRAQAHAQDLVENPPTNLSLNEQHKFRLNNILETYDNLIDHPGLMEPYDVVEIQRKVDDSAEEEKKAA